MNKKTMWNVALVLLVLLAMGIAAMPAAVVYYYPHQEPVAGSFFAVNEDAAVSICLPIAGLLTGISLMLVVAYTMSEKQSFLKPLTIVSFIAMFLGAVPVLVQSDVRVVTNAIHPIAEGIIFLLVRNKGKKPEKESGIRLKIR